MQTCNADETLTRAGYALLALDHAAELTDPRGDNRRPDGKTWSAEIAAHHAARCRAYMARACA